MGLQRAATAIEQTCAPGLGEGGPHPRADSSLGGFGRSRASLKHTSTFGHYASYETDWFMDLFGFREVSYKDTQRRLRARPLTSAPDAPWVLEGESGQSYQAGRFWLPSLGELEERALQLGGPEALRGRLRVQNVRGDVALKHMDPENRHATFQVASQFNCLEFLGPQARPEMGVTGYVRDKTQGPACSVACGPATVFRNYFAQVDGQQGQRADRQINNLQRLSAKLGNEPEGRYFRVQGGYTLADNRGLKRLNVALDRVDPAAYQGLRESLCVGLHEDVQVTSCKWGECPVWDEEQTVTQVFGSACSVSYSGNDKGLWEPFARLVLSASYEATLWAALLTALRHDGEAGSRRVYLTCLGGGVFGNDMRWIADAMEEALAKFRHVGLEVYIVTFSGPIPRQLERLER